MKKIIAVILSVCMLVCVATGCGSAADLQNVDAIKKAGELVVYTNSGFAPYEYPSNGKVVGVDMDIAQAIADKLGVKLVIEDVNFETIITAIQSGKGALGLAGITVTDERKESVDFSDTYSTSIQYIITPADKTVEKIEDLAGLTIGTQTGTTGSFTVEDAIKGTQDDDGNHVKGVLEDTGAKMVDYENAFLAAVALEAGKIDAVVVDKLPAEIIEKQYNGKFKIVELVYADGSKTNEQYAIAIAKGNDSLRELVNEVLKELKDNGKIDEWTVQHSTNAVIDSGADA